MDNMTTNIVSLLLLLLRFQSVTLCHIARRSTPPFDAVILFSPIFFQSDAKIKYQRVNCIIVTEREDVTVVAELPLANSLQVCVSREIFAGRDPPLSCTKFSKDSLRIQLLGPSGVHSVAWIRC